MKRLIILLLPLVFLVGCNATNPVSPADTDSRLPESNAVKSAPADSDTSDLFGEEVELPE